MSVPPERPFGEDGEQDGHHGGGRTASLTGQVRKVLLGGASALLGTEDGLRGALSDVKLPKDAVRLLLHQVERTRDEVTSLVGREVKRALRGVDLRGELRRALVGLRIDVRASVRFRDDGGRRDGAAGAGGGEAQEGPAVRLRSQVRRRRRRPTGPGRAGVGATPTAAAAEAADVEASAVPRAGAPPIDAGEAVAPVAPPARSEPEG